MSQNSRGSLPCLPSPYEKTTDTMATTTEHPLRQDSTYDTKEKDSIEQIERNPQHPEIIVDEKVHDPGTSPTKRTLSPSSHGTI